MQIKLNMNYQIITNSPKTNIWLNSNNLEQRTILMKK